MRFSKSQPFSLTAVVLALLVTVMALVLFCFDPTHYGFYPVCRFHQVTGLFCPGCGSLRALHQLLHGHLATALRFNGLLVCSLPFLGWAAARYLLARIKDQPTPNLLPPLWLWAAVVAVFGFTLLRNLPGGPAQWLAP